MGNLWSDELGSDLNLFVALVVVLVMFVAMTVMMLLGLVGLESILSLQVKIVFKGWALVSWSHILNESNTNVLSEGVLNLCIADIVFVTGGKHGFMHRVGKLLDLLVDGKHVLGLHAVDSINGDEEGKCTNGLNK